jgi:hypothetical protein
MCHKIDVTEIFLKSFCVLVKYKQGLDLARFLPRHTTTPGPTNRSVRLSPAQIPTIYTRAPAKARTRARHELHSPRALTGEETGLGARRPRA